MLAFTIYDAAQCCLVTIPFELDKTASAKKEDIIGRTVTITGKITPLKREIGFYLADSHVQPWKDVAWIHTDGTIFRKLLKSLQQSSIVPDRMQCLLSLNLGFGAFMGKQLWTEEEINLLKRLHADSPMEEITKELRRSVDQIRTKVKKLKLHRSKSFIASQRKRYAQFTI